MQNTPNLIKDAFLSEKIDLLCRGLVQSFPHVTESDISRVIKLNINGIGDLAQIFISTQKRDWFQIKFTDQNIEIFNALFEKFDDWARDQAIYIHMSTMIRRTIENPMDPYEMKIKGVTSYVLERIIQRYRISEEEFAILPPDMQSDIINAYDKLIPAFLLLKDKLPKVLFQNPLSGDVLPELIQRSDLPLKALEVFLKHELSILTSLFIEANSVLEISLQIVNSMHGDGLEPYCDYDEEEKIEETTFGLDDIQAEINNMFITTVNNVLGSDCLQNQENKKQCVFDSSMLTGHEHKKSSFYNDKKRNENSFMLEKPKFKQEPLGMIPIPQLENDELLNQQNHASKHGFVLEKPKFKQEPLGVIPIIQLENDEHLNQQNHADKHGFMLEKPKFKQEPLGVIPIPQLESDDEYTKNSKRKFSTSWQEMFKDEGDTTRQLVKKF